MRQGGTIVALATPPGRAGVAIIRMSGKAAYEIASKLSQQVHFEPRVATYTTISKPLGELIDKTIVIYFKAPHSFTGEDIIEIHAHGAPVLLDSIIQECICQGARLAEPGEFSERAFLNGKMDLAQAEAIADLIASHSLTAAKMALRTLQGDFSNYIKKLSQDIIQLRLFVEAAIDFPEEEIDFFSDGKVSASLAGLITTLEEVKATAKQGALMREGLSIVIAGKPNAGKSTLINHLAGREVAIVTEVAGTTRDVMREYITIDDLPVHIIDTAGLRESNDVVEKEGIRRAWLEVEQADCILLITDINDLSDADNLGTTIEERVVKNVPIIRIFNKIDMQNKRPEQEGNSIYLSAKTGIGIDLLKNAIKSAVGFQATEGKFLARRRHLLALDKANTYLLAGKTQLMTTKAFELLAEDLRLAHLALCEITGEFSSDDLLGEIFSSFCIGK